MAAIIEDPLGLATSTVSTLMLFSNTPNVAGVLAVRVAILTPADEMRRSRYLRRSRKDRVPGHPPPTRIVAETA